MPQSRKGAAASRVKALEPRPDWVDNPCLPGDEGVPIRGLRWFSNEKGKGAQAAPRGELIHCALDLQVLTPARSEPCPHWTG